jgi:hypothetical protein
MKIPRIWLLATTLLGAAAAAQQTAAIPGAPSAPLAVPNPHYVTLTVEQDVERPAAAVWARVGKFCDIGEWMRTTCVLTAGADGQLGAVRNVANGYIEMLVAKTDLSYTYAQPARVGISYNAYHGTLEVKPLGAASSRLVYSFFYDNSMMADDAARTAEIANRRSRFVTALATMKALAENGGPLH